MSIDPIIAVRGVHFAATVLAAGSASIVTLTKQPAAGLDLAPWHARVVGLTWSALAVAIASGALWLVLLAADLTGDGVVDVLRNGGVWTVLTATRFGWVTSARFVLGLAAGALMLWPATRWFALVAASGLIGLLALTGHSGATPGTAGLVQLVGDGLHLLAAGVWLGGLPAFALLLAQARVQTSAAWRRFAAQATRRFGAQALIAVVLLVATGLFNAWNLVATPRDLVVTDYGRLLTAKLALIAAMLAFAAVNRFRLTARADAPAAQCRLQRNSLAETALGLGVLLLVGALGTLPPTAHRHTAAVDIPSEAAFLHIHDVTAMADVTITPGRIGSASATIRVAREDGSEFAAKDVRLALAPPKATAASIDLPAIRQPDGSWVVQRLELRQAGNWTVRVTVTPESGVPFVLDAPVVIAP